MNKDERTRWEASKDAELKHNYCTKCKSKTDEVINAGENIRVGWYCKVCKLFEKTIGRERKIA